MTSMYSDKHIQILVEKGIAVLNLSEYALKELKTIVFVNLPDVGDRVETGSTFGDIESIKTVSDLISPINGKVEEVNEELLDAPELLTAENWIIKVSQFELNENEFMSEEQYKKYVEKCDV